MSSQLTDEALMERLGNGDKSALAALYSRYSTRLYNFALKLTGNDQESSKDVLHEVFLRLAEKPKVFDTSKRFKPWIFTVVANDCKKRFRANKLSYVDVYDDKVGETDLTGDLSEKMFRSELEEKLQQISFKHRLVFVLRYQQHASLQEIAEITNTPVGTVKSRLHYSIQVLSKELQHYKVVLDGH